MRNRPFSSARTMQCGGSAPAAPPDFSLTANIVVDATSRLQRMDGFGACDRDDPQALTDGQADTLFSPTLGVGLSFLKKSIYVDGSDASGFYTNATKAAARGAKVWAAPWTAPGAYKDNGTQNNGGNLLVAHYADWANILAGFQATLVSNAGVTLYALSVQEEPDFSDAFDSMVYTNAAMAAFIDVLGPKLATLSPVPLLMMPECADWPNVAGYVTAVAADTTAQSYLAIIASHQYAGVTAPSSTFRPIWQTEMSDAASPGAFDGSITNGLIVAQWIHDALVTGGVSAWHYWGILGPANADNEALAGDGAGNFTLTKRLYVLGNWSRFVRPGYSRVTTSGSIGGVLITGFYLPGSGPSVVVAVNKNAGPIAFTIGLHGAPTSSVTPWLTNAANNLVAQSPVGVANQVFTANLPASSVTSFVSN